MHIFSLCSRNKLKISPKCTILNHIKMYKLPRNKLVMAWWNYKALNGRIGSQGVREVAVSERVQNDPFYPQSTFSKTKSASPSFSVFRLSWQLGRTRQSHPSAFCFILSKQEEITAFGLLLGFFSNLLVMVSCCLVPSKLCLKDTACTIFW